MFGGLDYSGSKQGPVQPNKEVWTVRILAGNKCEWALKQVQGESPKPRTDHGAVAIGSDKLLIFGGSYTSNLRFNDVFILKIKDWMWTKPSNQPQSVSPKNQESKIGAPEPRCNHSLTYWPDENIVIVFGGHGGINFQRHSFNDMYFLNCETYEWSQVKYEGQQQPPHERAGHCATLMQLKAEQEDEVDQTKLVIYGGWSMSSQYQDVYLFDLQTKEWKEADVSDTQFLWNCSSIQTPSIPHNKFFVFGGSSGHFDENSRRTDSVFKEETYVLNIRSYDDQQHLEKFQLIPFEDVKSKPKAREQTALFFDSNDSRLIIFGGWNNSWLDDMWALNVANITGPSYAIFGIEPKMGPLTGQTEVTINGAGFRESGNIIVSFSKGTTVQNVEGYYINPNTITCKTPAFERPKDQNKHEIDAVVHIGIDKPNERTITKADFLYYLNTSAGTTLAYGVGLLTNSLGKTIFMIQSKNVDNKNRKSGSDKFIVEIVNLEKKARLEKEIEEEAEREAAAEKQRQADLENGEDESRKSRSQKLIEGDDGYEEQQEQIRIEEEERKEKEAKACEPTKKETAYIDSVITDNGDGTYTVEFESWEEQECDVKIYQIDANGDKTPIKGNEYTKSIFTKQLTKENTMDDEVINNHIDNKLYEIDQFILTSKKIINLRELKKFWEEDKDELQRIIQRMSLIEEVKEQQLINIDQIFEIDHYYSQKGQKYSQFKKLQNQDVSKKVKELRDEWDKLYKMYQETQKKIQEPSRIQSEKTQSEIKTLEENIKSYIVQMKQSEFYKYTTDPEEVEDFMKLIDDEYKKKTEFQEQLDVYKGYCSTFEIDEQVYSQCQTSIDTMENQVNAAKAMWNHISKCQKTFSQYKQSKWNGIDIDDMQAEVKTLLQQLKTGKGFNRSSPAYKEIQDVIINWQTFLPIIQELKESYMIVDDGRHWEKVKQEVKNERDGTGDQFEVNEDLELQTIWDLQLFNHKENLDEITFQAKEENKTEKDLKKIENKWDKCEFILNKHKNTDINMLKMDEEDFNKLEEDIQIINTMNMSKYVGYFEKDVERWKKSLDSVFDVVAILGEVQKTWQFLENLFMHSDEVQHELPKETEKFKKIDQDMRKMLKNGENILIFSKFCNNDVFKELEAIEKDLKVCEKALNEFLDKKRKQFPRFYFVSITELLDILSNGNNPPKINVHMNKIYQAIENITMDMKNAVQDRPVATEMHSAVGKEMVPFRGNALPLLDKVEKYLWKIILKMNFTLLEITREAIQNMDRRDEKKKAKYIQTYPSQILLLVNSIDWSVKTEECFVQYQSGNLQAMQSYLEELKQKIIGLIKIVQDVKLDEQIRQKIMCIITMDSHCRDVVDKLIIEGVKKADEFQWQSQLKMYWDSNKVNDVDREENSKGGGDTTIKIADAIFDYSYEYLGNGARLVITPLTDRIYVTATQALHLMMGCAPAGPAGTGKTETTKDLANCLAKAIYVFNCSSEMNYESMGNIFKGLASSGTWGCFDEFNRLLPEVLSVCSIQFKSVTDGIKEKVSKFVLQGDEIMLDPTCGVFITMNPGYLGRAELPEGLKALFRPITVVVPDLELICENMLMAEGFEDAKVLAKKFTTLYFLCRDLLSKQLHYDWGLRAIKSVLRVAGFFKRQDVTKAEDYLMMRALRDFNLPKIPVNDLEIFHGLLNDLFPGLNPDRDLDVALEDAARKACVTAKLFPEEKFIEKVVQLKELLEIRHCVFIMGPPGAGKTSCYKILHKTKMDMGTKMQVVDIDPKVVSTKDFYGYNLPSKDWKDGLFSKKMRDLSNIADPSVQRWLILDGDLDANWIESMNSVMDDNKILTLANNERIQLKSMMRIIFEIRDLRFATPATVSRAGILYISDDEGHQWQSFYKSWIQQMLKDGKFANEQVAKQIENFFQKLTGKVLEYLKKSVKYLIPMQAISQIISICKALEKLITKDTKHLEYLFVYAFVWAVGGSLTEKDAHDYRKEFSTWWKNTMKNQTNAKFPQGGSIFDYYVEEGESASFVEWKNKVPEIEYNPEISMGNVTVPTKDTIATAQFIKKYTEVEHPCLLIGNAGCGKTQLTKGILKEICSNKNNMFQFQIISFNFYTDSPSLQIQLESVLEKFGNKTYTPKFNNKGKHIYFIDDLNMPQVDLYDTQTAIALLRQLQDYNHWYDITKLDDKIISNTQVISCMNPFAGSFFVNPRYQRHFWTIAIPFPQNEVLQKIYLVFINGHLKQFKANIIEQGAIIVQALQTLHQKMFENFKKTAINFHYEFNLRHLSTIVQGILLSKPNVINSPDKLVKLFLHECCRTYSDRLVSYANIDKFKDIMAEIVKGKFAHLARLNLQKYFSGQNQENLLFTNFPDEDGMRSYEQVDDDRMKTVLNEQLNMYNQMHAKMNLVLFDDAMKHVLKICRIILPSSGHALLVGVGGSGKQSLTYLSTHIMDYSMFQIVINATYDIGDLKSDLQNLFNKCGNKEEQHTFMFNEGQITKERFLVYINDLLSSGEINDLYNADEKDAIISSTRGKVKAAGIPDTKDNIWQFFVDKIKQNLHMVINFSPAGEMRRRARQFPALVTCTVIDWFQEWPQEALLNVSKNFLAETNLGEDAEVRKAIVEFIPNSFRTVNMLSQQLYQQERRYVYTTPKSFLELIKLFKSMLEKNRTKFETSKTNYIQGQECLVSTEENVEVIQIESIQMEKDSKEKKEAAEKIAEVVGKEKAIVEEISANAAVEEKACLKIQSDVSKQKAETEEDLAKAQPLVEQAQEALKGLKKDDFSTAKAFAQPPDKVPEVFAATIFILAGHQESRDWIEVDKNHKPKSFDWKAAKLLMKDPEKLKAVLTQFKDKIEINDVFHNNINYVKQNLVNQDYFKVEVMANKSTAAKGLCDWVINIIKYYDVIQNVEPKRKALKEAITQLDEANAKLERVQAEVAELNAKLKVLTDKFDAATKDKEDAQAKSDNCKRRLDLAQRLIQALSSEKVRWGNNIVVFTKFLELLLGDVLMASAFVSYAGPFNKKFREIMINQYFVKDFEGNIPSSLDYKNCNAIKLLMDESKQAEWAQQKLPSDQVSIENGTILTNSDRYPLLIDPQLQGLKWLYEKEKKNDLKCLRLGSKKINFWLEQSVQNGYTCVIENMDEKIEAIYQPLISRQFIEKGSRKLLKFAGKDLVVNNKFQLYLHTKLSNPHYPPEIQAETSLINFTVTEQGLADQLLSLVVQRERPDLASQKVQLINEQNAFKIKLKELEEDLLQKLINQEGDILENTELIDNLEMGSKLSKEISIKVEIAKKTEAAINITSAEYNDAAIRGALFYFLLSDINKIHSFYKYSLESFIIVIHRAIDEISETKKFSADNMVPFGEEGEEEQVEEEKPESDSKLVDEKKEEEKESEKKEEDEKKEEGEEKECEKKEEEEVKEGSQKEGSQKEGSQKGEEEGSKKGSEEAVEELQDLKKGIKELSPKELKKRVKELTDQLTFTAFTYTMQGLFEKHKLIVSTMLTLRIAQRRGDLLEEEINHLIIGGKTEGLQIPPMPEQMKSYLTEAIWGQCAALQALKSGVFANLLQGIDSSNVQWQKWYREPETTAIPGNFSGISAFHRLLLLRAMRPDKVTQALSEYVAKELDEKYVNLQPFDIQQIFVQTSNKIPMFFVLFPGVDPTPEVELIGRKYDITGNNGRFTNISMGQGQEAPAKEALFRSAKKGHWIMLQNVHLMINWMIGLQGLEGFLEEIFNDPKTHANFRVFISSEPPPLPDQNIIPESILQASIKISNEAPQDIKANMRRAYAKFDQAFLDKSKKPSEFKACIFSLCWFHSVVLGRKKFGSLGWSRVYNFNDGDLRICADVLYNYLEKYAEVPWDDLRYIFGEIMYGGHITDNWDRRTNNTYLKIIITPEIMNAHNFIQQAPSVQPFKSPDPLKLDYKGYENYINTKLPVETPYMFHMHPNAEIGYLTQDSQTLFNTFLDISGGAKGGGSQEDEIVQLIDYFVSKLNKKEFDLLSINEKVQEKQKGPPSPYQVVVLQECERMNNLIEAIKSSLNDLKQGLNGTLNITDAMENLQINLSINKVPDGWNAVAYASKKNLSTWFADLLDRIDQLERWSSTLETPKSLCIAFLFNPMSFLTAIIQDSSRKLGKSLANMTIQTIVTGFLTEDDVTGQAASGAYIHGFYLEGASWENNQGNDGYLAEQKPKELHPKLPIVNVVAIELAQKAELKNQYDCPVYVTAQRGPTYVFTANLSIEEDEAGADSKWILSGTCLIMSDD